MEIKHRLLVWCCKNLRRQLKYGDLSHIFHQESSTYIQLGKYLLPESNIQN